MSFAAFQPFKALQPFRVPLGLSFLAQTFKEAALDLNFAKTKTLDPRITFTRTSDATYFDANGVMRTAANNVARFDHDPATGESLGLLVEESRTNIALQSGRLDLWGQAAGIAATANYAIAPDGTLSASRHVKTGTGYPDVNRIIIVPNDNTVYTFTVHIKKDPLATSFQEVSCDLLNGTTTRINRLQLDVRTGDWRQRPAHADGTVTVQDVGDWYRAVLTTTNNSTGNTTLRVGVAPSMGATQWTFANNVDGAVVLWGGQVEVGAFPTSYIPTTSAQVTRAPDVAVMTGTNFSGWWNQSEGTFYIDHTKIGFSGSTGFIFSVMSPDGRQNGNIEAGWRSNNVFRFANYRIGGTWNLQFLQDHVASTASRVKCALALKENDGSSAVNGTAKDTDTDLTFTPGYTRITFPSAASGERASGTIRRFTYWPTRLPNATLEALTK